MTAIDIIRNFAYDYRKPFQAETIAELTGIEIKVIRRVIRTLLAKMKSSTYQGKISFM